MPSHPHPRTLTSVPAPEERADLTARRASERGMLVHAAGRGELVSSGGRAVVHSGIIHRPVDKARWQELMELVHFEFQR